MIITCSVPSGMNCSVILLATISHVTVMPPLIQMNFWIYLQFTMVVCEKSDLNGEILCKKKKKLKLKLLMN